MWCLCSQRDSNEAALSGTPLTTDAAVSLQTVRYMVHRCYTYCVRGVAWQAKRTRLVLLKSTIFPQDDYATLPEESLPSAVRSAAAGGLCSYERSRFVFVARLEVH